MIKLLNEKIKDKKVLLLGFGKEGLSTYKLIRKYFPKQLLIIADINENFQNKINITDDNYIDFILGKDYLNNFDKFDLIIKSPGISLKLLNNKISSNKITSQTDLFIRVFSKQIIGITGTKGKSTTSSLLFHILKSFYDDVALVGNIGVPPFDIIDNIKNNTKIVFELSSHQLEYISIAPNISILLNLFQEHLDHYNNFSDYQFAKLNIIKYQNKDDYFVYNYDDKLLHQLIQKHNYNRNYFQYSLKEKVKNGTFIKDKEIVFIKNFKKVSFYKINAKKFLPGKHNLLNIMAVINACKILQVPDETIIEGITTFKGLEHRMEYIGKYYNIYFYNDSISTIPEATIEAIKTLNKVNTLILGGFDRGIDYNNLIRFLIKSNVKNIIFIGRAGKRIYDGMKIYKTKNQEYFIVKQFNEMFEIIKNKTKPNSICLLSPAAASYDMFENFEERGNTFKKLAKNM
ncbi:MAG: UDP-N-acetylmuramoyl-L-alanine--D-glutamate ligase [Bacteroidales bacterium]|nr:UDP-N-acetylmuramoyl-L-alanine--D-glutamate ligase [Bacteroidales bacterium]